MQNEGKNRILVLSRPPLAATTETTLQGILSIRLQMEWLLTLLFVVATGVSSTAGMCVDWLSSDIPSDSE
jgi:hypothetical protein